MKDSFSRIAYFVNTLSDISNQLMKAPMSGKFQFNLQDFSGFEEKVIPN